MIAHIKGILDSVYKDRVVVDVNGVGYNIFVPDPLSDSMPGTGEEVKFYTYTSVHEDSFLLYGFLYEDDLNMFKKLISVNGVGPKVALSILGSMDTDELKYAILSSDSKLVSMAQGVGKKMAERIILDLKDKLDWNETLIDSEVKKVTGNTKKGKEDDPLKKDAVSALIALGYNPKDANVAVHDIEIKEGMDVESVLKEALKALV